MISLDFELYWGMRDKIPIAGYRDNLLGVREAIPAMLDRFRQHGIHATWATVGMLMFDERESLLASLPPEHSRPSYANRALSPYDMLGSIGTDESSDPFHYGLSLVRQIAATPHQEIATHTFSHYYCLEAGQTEAQFRADLDAARGAAARLDIELESLVFPRNQYEIAYLPACRDAGLRAYRGNERAWMYDARAGDETSQAMRAARLLDSHVNLSGHHLSSRPPAPDAHGLHNVPASRFLRPVKPGAGSRALGRLRLARIAASMKAAALSGKLFHLWWHPHNFGAAPAENLAQLDSLLDHFSSLRQRHGFESLTMAEAAKA
ncbi:MAG: polysaccharide deacetylase family protein [Sphingomonadaceae bacterium]